MKLALTTIAAVTLAVTARAEDPFADLTFDQALARAGNEKKIVMVDFFTTWCAPCKLLDQVTWKHDGVRAWLADKTVALKIDAEQQADLASRYSVSAYPTIVFVKPDGTELDRIVGYKKPTDFLPEAEAIAAGKKMIDIMRERVAASGDDPLARHELARACLQRGLHEEALGHLLWCWDHGNGAGFSGVRASFLLSDIAQLGAVHAPALAALRQRRAEYVEHLLSGEPALAAPENLAADIAALDRTLGTPEETLRVYDALVGVQGYSPNDLMSIRDALFEHVADLLLDAGRYSDVVAAMDGDPEHFANRQLDLYRGMLDGMEGDHEMESALESVKRLFVTNCSRSYAALLGLGELERASTLAERIAEFETTYATYDTLANHAARHAADAAHATLDALLASARDDLDEKELARLERTVRRLKR